MPIPQKQLEWLNVDLRNHEEELAKLKTGPNPNQPDIHNEISFHETVLQVGRDPKVLALVEEINDNPKVADQLARDPNAFTRAKGIKLPPGGTIMVSKPIPEEVIVGVNYHIGRYHVSLQW